MVTMVAVMATVCQLYFMVFRQANHERVRAKILK